MTTRRGMLAGLAAGFWAFVSCSWRRRPDAGGAASGGSASGSGFAPLDQRLLEDFVRSSSRTYSEEGVPMFLVGEDLASKGAGAPVGAIRRDALGAELAADFRRCAEALPRVRERVGVEDVGKLVEVLAERDFGPEGKRRRS